jgi:hypothetical protein
MSPTPTLNQRALSRLARRLLLDSSIGADVELPRAGSALENSHVYDAVARELIQQAKGGRLQVVRSQTEAGREDGLILEFVFRRLA